MMLLMNTNEVFVVEYPDAEEASGQIETEMDGWDKI